MSVTLTVTTARVGRPLRSLAISKDDASAARVASAPKQRCASALESVVYLGHGQTASDPAEVSRDFAAGDSKLAQESLENSQGAPSPRARGSLRPEERVLTVVERTELARMH